MTVVIVFSDPRPQAIYTLISPGWFVTPIYGLDHFLFPSPIFWFGLPITIVLALLPRYLYMAWSFGVRPNDLDILNWNYKVRPNMDLIREAYLHQEVESGRAASPLPVTPVTPHSTATGALRRQSMQCSQIDMSTGVRSVSRGYSFAHEEGGVAMRRMQSNLSGALQLAPTGERRSRGTALLRSIRYPLRRKQPAGEQ